jgi:transcription elongation factor GreA
MNENSEYLTLEGVDKLKAELDELVSVRRPALAERLRRAIQQGDLSENADYIAAKEEQGFLEGRIQRIEALLHNAVVIETSGGSDEVRLGSQIVLVEVGNSTSESFLVVGPAEADPANGRISFKSPLGQALMGRQVGDTVRVEAPVGEILFRIKAIE